MQQIDLKAIFNAIKDEQYCVIKPNSMLPNYVPGSDVDIFCYSIAAITKKLLASLDGILSDKLRVHVKESDGQTYIDVIEDDSINIRFDLYSKFPIYKNILIKPAYFESILSDRVAGEFGQATLYVPYIIDDLILRYIEYNEWFAERGDKIKHVEYINDQVQDDDSLRKEMFDKLHHYIELPIATYDDKAKSKTALIYDDAVYAIEKLLFVYKRDGLKILIKKLAKRFK